MGQLVLEKKAQGVSFALCESCFWTASVLDVTKCGFSSCPFCLEKSLALMPIADNETYSYSLLETRNLELHFSLRDGASQKVGADD